MAIQDQAINLEIIPGGVIPTVHASQYDVGRVLKFVIYDGNSPAVIPSGTTATIEGTKPDKHAFQYEATIADNVVTAPTTQQMTAVPGSVECTLTLTYESQVIGTALFILEVERNGIQDDAIISDTEIPVIIALATEQMEAAQAAAESAGEDAASAETNALKAEGHAVGTQDGEAVPDTSPYYHNNAEYYAGRAAEITENLPNALIPKGTCLFAELPSISASNVGDMWNISDNFTTTADFRGGAGVNVPAGSYVYLTDSNKWDVLFGHSVAGVKGNSEATYRTGNVNLTPADIGLDSVLNTASQLPIENAAVANAVNAINEYGCKNLLPNEAVAKAEDGITWTVNSDGTVIANGTASSNTRLTLNYGVDGSGWSNKILSGSIGGTDDTYYIVIQQLTSPYNTYAKCTSEEVVISEISGNVQCFIYIKSGTVCNNLIFHPMIRDARFTNADYVPFAMSNKQLTDRLVQIGQHIANYVVLGAGWNGYCYGFIPFKGADELTLTLDTVGYFNGSTYTDVTSSFGINSSSISSDGFAIECTSSKDYVGKAVRVTFTASAS